jgi:tetratricopeptide (TPR) repeat protein
MGRSHSSGPFTRRFAHHRFVHTGLETPPALVPDAAGLVSTLLLAARTHFAAGSYETADAFLKLIPQPGTSPRETWQQLGHLHFSLAEYDAAGRAYGFAAAHSPGDASLQVRLAHTCLRLDDIPSFESYLGRALALDPESPPALQLLADLNRDEGRYAEAAGYYQRLLQETPGHYANLLSLALCHSLAGDSETALDLLQRAGQLPTSGSSNSTLPASRADAWWSGQS